mmetsp:Transcript_28467/g.72228  ORF Transcript_28467/g.72228 Transcript_28467/m.72228 type:complete len:217 (-) Transcript_28467:211-861(-)
MTGGRLLQSRLQMTPRILSSMKKARAPLALILITVVVSEKQGRITVTSRIHFEKGLTTLRSRKAARRRRNRQQRRTMTRTKMHVGIQIFSLGRKTRKASPSDSTRGSTAGSVTKTTTRLRTLPVHHMTTAMYLTRRTGAATRNSTRTIAMHRQMTVGAPVAQRIPLLSRRLPLLRLSPGKENTTAPRPPAEKDRASGCARSSARRCNYTRIPPREC